MFQNLLRRRLSYDSTWDWEARNSQEETAWLIDWSIFIDSALLVVRSSMGDEDDDDEIHLTRVQSWSLDMDDPEAAQLRFFSSRIYEFILGKREREVQMKKWLSEREEEKENRHKKP